MASARSVLHDTCGVTTIEKLILLTLLVGGGHAAVLALKVAIEAKSETTAEVIITGRATHASAATEGPTPATAAAPASPTSAPSPAPPEPPFGVDRGEAFSKSAVDWMKAYNDGDIHVSRSKCNAAVKRALVAAGTIPMNGVIPAKDMADVMRKQAIGYRELSGYTWKDIQQLEESLPVGTVIVYEPHDAVSGLDPVNGHIEVVAMHDGKKSLVSDYIARWDNGWGRLGGTKPRNITVSIFVPTQP